MADSAPTTDTTDAGEFVAAERAALCDLFDELGPDAPTLSGEWTTADLAAHLWARERRPDTGPGLVVGGPFASHTEKVRKKLLADRDYGDIVADLRSGPPWYALSRMVASMDVHEWFVHHEDVRRPAGLEARELGAGEQLVWKVLGRFAKPLTRSLEVGLVLATPSGETRTVKEAEPSVTVTGSPGELMLRLFGRGVADVEVSGSEAAVEAFETASFGI